jgi:hypothetical protein
LGAIRATQKSVCRADAPDSATMDCTLEGVSGKPVPDEVRSTIDSSGWTLMPASDDVTPPALES